jgi:hypothetical protein
MGDYGNFRLPYANTCLISYFTAVFVTSTQKAFDDRSGIPIANNESSLTHVEERIITRLVHMVFLKVALVSK